MKNRMAFGLALAATALMSTASMAAEKNWTPPSTKIYAQKLADETMAKHPELLSITLHGTLLHPAVGVKAENLAAQAGVAVALGTLLTPFAAALAFIDPGLAKNKDCSAVMAEVQADVSDQTPPPAQAAPPQNAPPQPASPQGPSSPNGRP